MRFAWAVERHTGILGWINTEFAGLAYGKKITIHYFLLMRSKSKARAFDIFRSCGMNLDFLSSQHFNSLFFLLHSSASSEHSPELRHLLV